VLGPAGAAQLERAIAVMALVSDRTIDFMDVDGQHTGKREAGHFKGIYPSRNSMDSVGGRNTQSHLATWQCEEEYFCRGKDGIFYFLEIISCQSGGEMQFSLCRKTRRSD
jgi:hypothetical protein